MSFGVLGPALGLGAFVFALQFQVSAMPAVPPVGVDPGSINRTLKSDRLPVIPAAVRSPQRAEPSRLPEGCAEAANWNQKTIYEVEIPGRCIG